MQFAVVQTTRQGEEMELGMARLSLEKILAKGKDHGPGPLAVVDKRGEDVGELTCTVRAVAALKKLKLLPDADPKVTPCSHIVII